LISLRPRPASHFLYQEKFSIRSGLPKASSRSARPSGYRSRGSREWRKTKVSEAATFVITGFAPREAVAVTVFQGH
jgi:hypothetical protein